MKENGGQTLSKAQTSTVPAWLMELGEMQKTCLCFSLRCANTVPTVIAAGSAGGTLFIKQHIFSSMAICTIYDTEKSNSFESVDVGLFNSLEIFPDFQAGNFFEINSNIK